MLEEEELHLVHKAVGIEMREISEGKVKNYSLEEIRKTKRKKLPV
jgi:DNA-directed RNA polymerase subunit K/omega